MSLCAKLEERRDERPFCIRNRGILWGIGERKVYDPAWLPVIADGEIYHTRPVPGGPHYGRDHGEIAKWITR